MEAIAKWRNIPTSTRKMRLVADMVRGMKVIDALNVLRFESKVGGKKIEQLLKTAVANWENKYEDYDIDEADLYIKEIFVDGGRMLKRLRPAPQGRGHRIRKRSNHVTLIIDSANDLLATEENKETTEKE